MANIGLLVQGRPNVLEPDQQLSQSPASQVSFAMAVGEASGQGCAVAHKVEQGEALALDSDQIAASASALDHDGDLILGNDVVAAPVCGDKDKKQKLELGLSYVTSLFAR